HRPRSEGPVTEFSVGKRTASDIGNGVNPHESPGSANVTECRGAISSRGPVRMLVAAQFWAEAPWAGIESPKAWNDTFQIR
ncbi:MAG: hypothetical protein AAB327_02100, partial [Actinomycetota bacterium]